MRRGWILSRSPRMTGFMKLSTKETKKAARTKNKRALGIFPDNAMIRERGNHTREVPTMGTKEATAVRVANTRGDFILKSTARMNMAVA